MQGAAPRGPLSGFRILDLTAVVVGPSCTLTLAEQGAEVIKLEPPEGDLLRKLGGPAPSPDMSPKFIHFNRGKRSIAVDLKTEAGRAVLARLAERADVLVTNMRGGALARLGITWDALRPRNPRLVFCVIAGFGSAGRHHDSPAYDTIIQGMSGFAAALGRVLGEPRFAPFVLCDHITGIIASQAITAALLMRERTGEGQAIEVPMYESMAHFVLAEHMFRRTFDPAGPTGDPRVMNPDARPIPTADGYIAVSANTDAQAFAFFEAIGRPELKDDPRFSSVGARFRNVEAYFTLRAEALRSRSTAEWAAEFRRREIPAMPFQSIEAMLEDPHLWESGLLRREVHPTEGPMTGLGRPVRFSAAGPDELPLAPRLSAHAREVLAEAGYGEAEIAALLGRAVLPPPA
ncbi:CaiB/BaiF CoA transferase family protein [Paracraurococcus ruber]|uniref:Formyl-CoA transferase n=1 Tax=Paracraurococcus ruber TaxID=77675 RepID=A0ABS1D4E3_9PROT|nr:CoA transferase [Paracraurococcus ruber]MBK1660947.1 formyl-CoA transferase [Paracraurococcus ruber]TDG24347.1 CoA transferase [Paracraurococcus ruber]